MQLFIVEYPDGKPMLRTLANSNGEAKSLAEGGSGNWKWQDFSDKGYSVHAVDLKKLE